MQLERFRVSRCVKHVVIWNGGIRYELASVYVCSLKKKKKGICPEPWRSISGVACASFWLVTLVKE